MTMRRLASGILGLLLFLTSSVASATATQWPQAGASFRRSCRRRPVPASATRCPAGLRAPTPGHRIVLQHYTSSTGFPCRLPTPARKAIRCFASVDTWSSTRTAAHITFHTQAFGRSVSLPNPHVVVNNDLPVHLFANLPLHGRYRACHFVVGTGGSYLAGEAYLKPPAPMVHVLYAERPDNLVSGDIQ